MYFFFFNDTATTEIYTYLHTLSLHERSSDLAFEKRQLRSRPVGVEILSTISIEKLPTIDAATWIDRELVADAPTPLRDAGFGREVKAAQALRRQWLIAEQLAGEQGGQEIGRAHV